MCPSALYMLQADSSHNKKQSIPLHFQEKTAYIHYKAGLPMSYSEPLLMQACLFFRLHLPL